MLQGVDVSVRQGRPVDSEAVASIYNEGIAERRSTFETELRCGADLADWLASPRAPLVVAERCGRIVGWARVSSYSLRPCYAGVGEGSIYVTASQRGHGVGRALGETLVCEAERVGIYKLLGKLFPENEASRRLVARLGFREVGLHLRHGRLDGEWRDVLLVELLLGEAVN